MGIIENFKMIILEFDYIGFQKLIEKYLKKYNENVKGNNFRFFFPK